VSKVHLHVCDSCPESEQHWFAVTTLTFVGFFACVSTDMLSTVFPLSRQDVVDSVDLGKTPPHWNKLGLGVAILLVVTACYGVGVWFV
jgi:hypothetical protein